MIFAALCLFLAGFAVPSSPAPQDDAQPATLGRVNPEAQARWERMIAASRPLTENRAPITAFILRADVRFRGEGTERNDLKVDYRYLAPHFLRTLLETDRETGRGPGQGQRAYWVREGDKVEPLVGRDHREGRRQVDEMLAVAKNFIALTDPARLKLTKLELLPAPPTGLPRPLERKVLKKLDWIRVASKDFALVLEQIGKDEKTPRVFEVDLGISRENDLPVLAIIREANPRIIDGVARPSNPLLFHLEDWRPQDGFRVPWMIKVHRLEATPLRVGFSEFAAQDIVLLEAQLRPQLKEADFAPE